MMFYSFLFLNVFFMISNFMFCFYYKHILLTLISLEFMMINLTWNMYLISSLLYLNMYFMSMFISINICEGILGLSILVNMIHSNGNDYSNILNLIKW